MTLHICRDFLTMPSASSPVTNMYLMSAFLQHVLSYEVFAQVNFDITSSAYLASQSGQEISTYASINNQGVGRENYVLIPSSTYLVQNGDVGRILALRSKFYPTYNSGLFRVTAIDEDTNSLIIDYRSPESPLLETGSLPWRLFENETLLPAISTGSNGYAHGKYQSRDAASASRVLFNAPGGWHLRLCMESPPDVTGTLPGGFSIAPGAGHLRTADFDDASGNLHGAMWFNSTSSIYRGMVVGLSPSSNQSTGQWRVTMVGDDASSTCLVFNQNVTFTSGGTGWAAFGLPEDESLPLSSNIIDRLFVVGYGNKLPNLTWQSGFFNDGHTQGVAWSTFGFPIPCVMSSYADIRNLDPHWRTFASSLSGSAFLSGSTELTDVQLIAGTMSSSLAHLQPAVVPFAPRRVGRFPFARQGRATYATWTLSPDKQWLHTQDGIFVPWNGPLIDGSRISANPIVQLATGSFADATDPSETDGAWFLDANPPMNDPPLPPVDPGGNIDASRFKKTYSYFRQVPNIVQSITGGSNPAKT